MSNFGSVGTIHSSGHIKYQELTAFYTFIRGIIPDLVISNIFTEKPDSSFVKLPSFTGPNGDVLDIRGWTYVSMDEALEMVIVRHRKSSDITLIHHLENAYAWLGEVLKFRSLSRFFTGASRACVVFRDADESCERNGPLDNYDRYSVQWKTVQNILEKKCDFGFLSQQHRNAELLMNIFSVPNKRIDEWKAQRRLLDIMEHGKKLLDYTLLFYSPRYLPGLHNRT